MLMPEFNLLIKEHINTTTIKWQLSKLCCLLILALSLFHFSVQTILNHKIKQQEARIDYLHRQLKQLTAPLHIATLTTPSTFNIKQWLETRERAFKPLFKLYTKPTTTFCFASIQLTHDALIVTGTAPSSFALSDALLHSTLMKQFAEINVNMIEQDQSGELMRFQLTCK